MNLEWKLTTGEGLAEPRRNPKLAGAADGAGSPRPAVPKGGCREPQPALPDPGENYYAQAHAPIFALGVDRNAVTGERSVAEPHALEAPFRDPAPDCLSGDV